MRAMLTTDGSEMGIVLKWRTKEQRRESLIAKAALISQDHPFRLRLEGMIADLQVEIETRAIRRHERRPTVEDNLRSISEQPADQLFEPGYYREHHLIQMLVDGEIH